MKLALVLKITALLTPVLIWLLRRSKHPVARKLLTDVGSRWDPTGMSPGTLKASARRFLLFGLAAVSLSALLITLANRFVSGSAMQVAVGFAAAILVTISFMALLNAGHFALIAFSLRAAERKGHAQLGTVSPVTPR